MIEWELDISVHSMTITTTDNEFQTSKTVACSSGIQTHKIWSKVRVKFEISTFIYT